MACVRSLRNFRGTGVLAMMRKLALCLLVLGACSTDYGDDDSCDYCGGGSGSGSSGYPTPQANDDHIMRDEDSTLSFSTLMANDVNVQTIKVVDAPLHGTINGSYYTPDPGYFGVDQFTYDGKYTDYASQPSSRAHVYHLINSVGIPYETAAMLASTNAQDLAAGDVDGDGKIDLVTCNDYLNQMTVFVNTTSAAGKYSVEPHTFEGGTSPQRIVVADIDGDGKQDILTAASNGVNVFRNITTGPLAFDGPVTLAANMTALVVVDLDGDGKKDLAAVEGQPYYSSGYLHAWRYPLE